MADKTVDLVIRARNEATATLNAIRDSLSSLTTAQTSTGASASRTQSAIGGLVEAMAALQAQAKGLEAFKAATANLDALAKNADLLKVSAAEAADKAARLGRVSAGLKAQSEAANERLAVTNALLKTQALEAANDARALKALDSQINATANRLGALDRKSSGGNQLSVSDVEKYQRLQDQLRSLQDIKVTVANSAGISSGAVAALAVRQGIEKTAADTARQGAGIADRDFNVAAGSAKRLADTLARVTAEYDAVKTTAREVGAQLGITAADDLKSAAAAERNAVAQGRLQEALSRQQAREQFRPGRFEQTDAPSPLAQVRADLDAARPGVQQARNNLGGLQEQRALFQEELERNIRQKKNSEQARAFLAITRDEIRAANEELGRQEASYARIIALAKQQAAVTADARRAVAAEARRVAQEEARQAEDHAADVSIARFNVAAAGATPRPQQPREDQEGRFAPGPAAAAVTAYKAQKQALAEAAEAAQAANLRVAELSATFRSAQAPTIALAVDLETAKVEAASATNEFRAQEIVLSQLTRTIREQAAARKANAQAEAEAAVKRDLDAVVKQQEALRIATQEVGNAEQALFDRFRAGSGILDTHVGRLVALAAGYAALAGGLHAVESAVKVASDLEAAQVRVTLALNAGSEAGAAAFESIKNRAIALKLPILEVVDGYSKFLSSVKGTTLEGEEAAKIFDDLLVLSRAFKLDPENINRASIALRDIAASGRITAREIRQLDQALPVGLFSKLAAAAGYSSDRLADFTKAVREGKINLDVLQETFDKAAASAAKGLEPALQTAQSTFADFKNAVLLAEQQLADGGLLTPITDAVNQLTAALKSDEGRNAIRQLGAALGAVVQVASVLLPYAKQIGVAFVFIGSVKLFSGIIASAQAGLASLAAIRAELTAVAVAQARQAATAIGDAEALAVLSTAEGEAAVATGALGVAFKALLGPIGLALGLAAIVTAFVGYAASAQNAADVTELYAKALSHVRDASQGLAGKDPIKDRKDTLNDAERAVFELRNAVEASESALNTLGLKTRAQGNFFSLFSPDQKRDLLAIADFIKGLDGKPLAQIRQEFDALNKTISSDAGRERIAQLGPALQDFYEKAQKLSAVSELAKENGSSLTFLNEAAARAPGEFAKVKAAVTSTGDAMTAEIKALDKFRNALENITKEFPELAKEAKLAQQALDFTQTIKLADRADFEHLLGTGQNTTKSGDEARATLSRGQDAQLSAELGKTLKNADQLDNLVTRIFRFEAGSDPANFPGKRAGQEITSADLQRTGALGQGQFLRETFETYFKRTFPDISPIKGAKGDNINTNALSSDQIAALRINPEVARAVARTFVQDIEAQLVRAGNDPSARNVYLGYNLGPSGANRLLAADPNSLARDNIDPKAYAGNRALYGNLTVAQALDKIAGIVGGNSRLTSTGQTVAEAASGAQTEAIDREIAKLQAERQGSNLNDRDKFINSTVEASRAKLTDPNTGQLVTEGAQLNEQQQALLDKVRAEAAATYDSVHARENEKKAVADLLGLEQQRKTLIEELKQQLSEGDISGANKTRTEIAKLTDEILKAIPAARTLATTFGDTKGIASLEKTQLEMQKLKADVVVTGKQINEQFAGGFTTAFDSFLQSVSEGKNAFRSLGDAFRTFAASFLKQIADMIIKQTALNLISGLGLGNTAATGLNGIISPSVQNFGSLSGPLASANGGITSLFSSGAGALSGIGSSIGSGFSSIGSFFASIFHDGGDVGGVSNRRRAVSPALFANAPRFHNGGFPGLAPDEIPIIAQRGEQIHSRAQVALNAKTQAAPAAPGGSTTHIYNLLDADEAASAILNTPSGEKAVLNHIRTNKSTVKSVVS